ncbi:MAG: glycoside hydrolase family 15 protein [Acidimicrobiales bacterium]
MPLPLEDYAIIGDTHTAALVGRDGSIDWLCLPRFDSGACFAKLLGDDDNGYWKLSPKAPVKAVRRRYRERTMVLETEFDTEDGTVMVTDCMPVRERFPEVARLVTGISGRVEMTMELVVRFHYGSIVPWVRRLDGMLSAVAGPDALYFWSPVHTRGKDHTTTAEFAVSEGQQVPFSLAWNPSHSAPPRPTDARYATEETATWWEEWSSTCGYEGQWRQPVVRSLITLKALTYAPTGGIVAAVTTSLPEQLGGARNWDYRYCWLRDATLTLYSLMSAGYKEEAAAWRDWLLRAVAGDPADLQIMYGPGGERRIDESELDWLSGYEGARPVRIGNAAAGQYQLDVYGEVMDALHESRRVGIDPGGPAWDLQRVLMDFIETGWRKPDDGIWEVRGPQRHFTHSKIMAWVAMDRAVKGVEEFGLEGPVEKWRKLRQEIFDEVCDKGFNPKVGAFTQYYGTDQLDASILMMAMVGFLPCSDDRVRSTVEAIERDLTQDGFVLRYRPDKGDNVDGLTGGEGAFLACSFWLVDNLAMLGRHDDARKLFERLVALRNDVGLLSEEYDPVAGRLVGNFPQAFSHVSLVNSAYLLSAQGSRSRMSMAPAVDGPGEVPDQLDDRANGSHEGSAQLSGPLDPG